MQITVCGNTTGGGVAKTYCLSLCETTYSGAMLQYQTKQNKKDVRTLN